MQVSARPGVARAASTPWSFRSRPLWVLAGQTGMIAAIVLGFGAYDSIPPKQFLAVMTLLTTATILLGPVGNLRRVVVTLPMLALVFWWMASYAWTFNTYGWGRRTQLEIPLILGAVAIASLLPRRALETALLWGCYLSIGYTLVALVLRPGEAMINPDGAPGWRGSFIHKNAMAPFLLFAMIAGLCFERVVLRRRLLIAIGLFLILMSQSTTSLAAGIVLFPASWLIGKLTESNRRRNGPLVLLGGSVALSGGLFSLLYLPQLLALSGKDPTLTRRTEIWARVWGAIRQRPWNGYGMGGVWIDQSAEPTLTMMRGLGFNVFHAHNGFLEMWLQLGVVGLIILVLILGGVIASGLSLLTISPSWGRFMVLFVLLIMLTSLVEVTTFGIWLALLCAFRAVGLKQAREFDTADEADEPLPSSSSPRSSVRS